jgi:hypothetical protein
MKPAIKMMIKPFQNERGQAVVNFIFAAVLILSTASLLMCISVALAVTEVIQYVSFSGSRAYFAADYDVSTQQANATSKMRSLISSIPVINRAQNGWIEIKALDNAARNYRGDYDGGGERHPNYHGVEISFDLKILKFRIPFVNSALDYNGEESPTATVSSLLGREPTFVECKDQMSKILDSVVRKQGAYARMRRKGVQEGQFKPILDNGC